MIGLYTPNASGVPHPNVFDHSPPFRIPPGVRLVPICSNFVQTVTHCMGNVPNLQQ